MKCSICGSEIGVSGIAYLRGGMVICSKCFPSYYVRNCPLATRRLRGESPISCKYCSYKPQCDSHIGSLVANSKGE
ncbi:hypothetical protein GCM10007981_07300 [Thermocladium modestius]|uniref:Uncharacterized protein n=1 Tax=Thermocladium modestius TaxID=62609 RepID=A0A830GTG0_9CREN|nr:hypothetical protein [Thermocladium modestius]GGP20197.1 hypothetical protein GCM10007981_07300 [Thermocladium modestius]